MRPGQKRWDNESDTLARTRRRETHDMLRPVMPQIAPLHRPKEYARGIEQPCLLDLCLRRPARRAVGGDQPVLSRPPERPGDGDDNAEHAAGSRYRAGPVEDRWGIGLVGVPPLEQAPGQIDRIGPKLKPGRTEPRLMPKLSSRPLRREPDHADHDREYSDDMADKELGWSHRSLAVLGTRSPVKSAKDHGEISI